MKKSIISFFIIVAYVNLLPYACRLWRGLDWVTQYFPCPNEEPILISLLWIIFFIAWASLPAVPLFAAFLLRKSIPLTFFLSKFVAIALLVYGHYDNDLTSSSTAAISLIIIPIEVAVITSAVAGVFGTIEFLVRRRKKSNQQKCVGAETT
jgi:hypothetical protein